MSTSTDTPTKIKVAENVKRLREERNWTQKDFADALSAQPAHINKIENGKLTPSLEMVMRIAECLKVSIDDLIYSTNEMREIKIEDEALSERFKRLNSMDEKDREIVIRMIDALLTQQHMREVLGQGQRNDR